MSYAEIVAQALVGKIVEVYIGDNHEVVTYADNSKSVPAVVIGKVVEGIGDCLVLDCAYSGKNKQLSFGNKLYLNTYNIVAICEIDGRGTLKDTIYSSDDTPHLPGSK